MPIGMTIVMVLTIAGILAMFLVWRELDRVERIVEEAERRRLGLSRPTERLGEKKILWCPFSEADGERVREPSEEGSRDD